jgi:anaerobic selenocysteine-containing dehydrogenase
VTLEDFDHSDAVFCIGHNPGTNHPRMLTTLREVSKRGAPIIVFNPLRERGLERFMSPQSPLEMLTLSSTPIASTYYLVKVGGDIAVLKGMMKTLLGLDAKSLAEGGPGVLDRDFIANHTTGIDALLADLNATPGTRSRRPRVCRDRISSPSAISTPRWSGSSSITAWGSPSIVTVPATCSRSPIC